MYLTIKKKYLVIFSVFLFSFIFLGIKCFGDNSISWGLSFKESNSVPIGNASSDYLKEYNAYYYDEKNPKNLYLTFDCGYEAGYTEDIMATLLRNNVPACFFITGSYITSNPDKVSKMVNSGFCVGNHTNTHPDMSKLETSDSFYDELQSVENMFYNLTGKEIDKFYRPPQGIFSENDLENVSSLGYKTILWSVAHVDWDTNNQPDEKLALEKLLDRVHDGAIILLHAQSQTNCNILNDFIQECIARGYTFSSLYDLYKQK